MKAFSFLRAPLFMAAFFLAVGCQKEKMPPSSTTEQEIASQGSMKQTPVTRGYHDHFDLVLVLRPDFAAGWTPADPSAPAWYHGPGNGNASHMGKANAYINSHTIRNAANTVMVSHAPVTMFYASQLSQYSVPSDVSGVIYDGKGNSIWLRIAPEGLPSWHVDATHIAMEGKVFIVGGTGKFDGATGETTFHAQFDQASFNQTTFTFTEASMSQDGWIRY
jgi:hypothetical protein